MASTTPAARERVERLKARMNELRGASAEADPSNDPDLLSDEAIADLPEESARSLAQTHNTAPVLDPETKERKRVPTDTGNPWQVVADPNERGAITNEDYSDIGVPDTSGEDFVLLDDLLGGGVEGTTARRESIDESIDEGQKRVAADIAGDVASWEGPGGWSYKDYGDYILAEKGSRKGKVRPGDLNADGVDMYKAITAQRDGGEASAPVKAKTPAGKGPAPAQKVGPGESREPAPAPPRAHVMEPLTIEGDPYSEEAIARSAAEKLKENYASAWLNAEPPEPSVPQIEDPNAHLKRDARTAARALSRERSAKLDALEGAGSEAARQVSDTGKVYHGQANLAQQAASAVGKEVQERRRRPAEMAAEAAMLQAFVKENLSPSGQVVDMSPQDMEQLDSVMGQLGLDVREQAAAYKILALTGLETEGGALAAYLNGFLEPSEDDRNPNPRRISAFEKGIREHADGYERIAAGEPGAWNAPMSDEAKDLTTAAYTAVAGVPAGAAVDALQNFEGSPLHEFLLANTPDGGK